MSRRAKIQTLVCSRFFLLAFYSTLSKNVITSFTFNHQLRKTAPIVHDRSHFNRLSLPNIHCRITHEISSLTSSSALHVKPPSPSSSYDMIIVGSGIGGLSCAAMLSLYGYSVAVFESHYSAGGCAHGFRLFDKELDGWFDFDTGPSFFSGLSGSPKSSNPIRTVLDAIGETVESYPYKTFGLYFPEGKFMHTSDFGSSASGALNQVSGPDGMKQWAELLKKMKPLSSAVEAIPTAALRGDVGALRTVLPYLSEFAKINPLDTMKLTWPFGRVVEGAGVTDRFAKNWLDLLCFCLSGLPASGTITAEMAMMMDEFYAPDATMDCPKGGAKAIVDALVRGIEKNGGKIFLNSHVEKIIVEDGRATGIQLKKNAQVIRADKAVISNMSVWDLFSKKNSLLDHSALPNNYVQEKLDTPVGKSFMHLHIGFQATPEELQALQPHYMYLHDWDKGVDAQDNAALLSIPSVLDDSLAPSGHAVLHIYTPATEDFAPWKDIKRNTKEYQTLKETRSAFLWEVLEKVIPDIRARARVIKVGTPLTHARFLRRHQGSYGPAIQAGKGSFPFPGTPLKGLFTCGDSCFPGIGVPAVAGSGILAANSVSLDSIGAQLKLLEELRLEGK